jgi:hypothetical protein
MDRPVTSSLALCRDSVDPGQKTSAADLSGLAVYVYVYVAVGGQSAGRQRVVSEPSGGRSRCKGGI